MSGGAALPADSMGAPWNGSYVFTTGNIILDLLHNFFLENGARIHKLRVYETVNDPVSREVCGYLLVRGSVHAHAYALAPKQLTGVDMTKMLPVPNIPNEKFPEARRYMQEGSLRRLYRFRPNDYAEISAIWGNGEQALPGDPAGKLEVVDGAPDAARSQTSQASPARSRQTISQRRSSRSRTNCTKPLRPPESASRAEARSLLCRDCLPMGPELNCDRRICERFYPGADRLAASRLQPVVPPLSWTPSRRRHPSERGPAPDAPRRSVV
jgi:hypothetical protein